MTPRKKRPSDNRGRAPDQMTGHEFNARQARLALARQQAKARDASRVTGVGPKDGAGLVGSMKRDA